ncbi:MAG: septal ring lytic transglycosylase RlpA family lipoprotein, partial [Chitinophagia bacterium]|nr:septal ring lytic transglycosylase RlpA family lipoprotein [Chitinophagia bacterium]
GEIFDNNAYTAACNAYPFGTYIAVTNQQNGKTVCVKVTDRIANKARLIDLTVAAAKYIDMIKSGVVKVTVKKLKPSKGEALISEQMQPQ